MAVLPLAYLVVALVYSANSAPWGRQVDPESAYMMNGVAWSAGFGMILNSHPGTTTILLSGLVTKIGALLSGQPDIVEFALRYYDALIYASRAAQIVLMAVALLAGGIIVRRATQSAIAAAIFQIAPFVSFDALHLGAMLTTESLLMISAVLGMALVIKAALDEKPPSLGLGIAQGVIFALGLSSKYFYRAAGDSWCGVVPQLASLCGGDPRWLARVLYLQSDPQPVRLHRRVSLARQPGDAQGHLRQRRARALSTSTCSGRMWPASLFPVR